jgi:glyoxalase family protein
MKTLISGLHHVTAIASDPQRNLDFYAGLLAQAKTRSPQDNS